MSKLKHLLRKAAARNVDAVCAAIGLRPIERTAAEGRMMKENRSTAGADR